MAQYGSGDDQYVKEGHQSTNEYGHNNPLQSTTEGQEFGGTGTTAQTHGYEQAGKHEGGILHRSGSGSSSSSEDDGEGGRRKKKGIVGKIKEKLPGGADHGTAAGDEYNTTSASTGGVGGGGYGYEAPAGGVVEGHEKKGVMEKIKEKLPGGADHGTAANEYNTTSAPAAGTGVSGGGGGYGYDQAATGGVAEGHEKKGLMDKIKDKLPGGHQ